MPQTLLWLGDDRSISEWVNATALAAIYPELAEEGFERLSLLGWIAAVDRSQTRVTGNDLRLQSMAPREFWQGQNRCKTAHDGARFLSSSSSSSVGRISSFYPAYFTGYLRLPVPQGTAARALKSYTILPARSVISHSSLWLPSIRPPITSAKPKVPFSRRNTAMSASDPTAI
jgi:hypothetical protein